MPHQTVPKQLRDDEAFGFFFRSSLDKKMQYADWEELTKFVFGSVDNAISKFEDERETWEIRGKVGT